MFVEALEALPTTLEDRVKYNLDSVDQSQCKAHLIRTGPSPSGNCSYNTVACKSMQQFSSCELCWKALVRSNAGRAAAPKRPSYKFQKKAARTKKRGQDGATGAYDGSGVAQGRRGGVVRA